MKLETIKKNKRKKIIIGGMIVFSVVGCLTLTITRAKYRNVQSLKLASGTVEYKASDLHLVAIKVSEDGENYTNQTDIPGSGYTLNTEKSKCHIPTSTLVGEEAPEAEGVSIEYVNNKINVLGVTKKDTRCYVYFDKILGQTSSTIIADIKARIDGSYKGNTTPMFTEVATGTETETNNGIFETDDPMYGSDAKTYYWRGAATTNHVIFDSKCWRIVRINGDGSIRLIYNGAVQSGNTCKGNGSWDGSIVLSGTKYNSLYDNNSYVGWSYIAGRQRPSEDVPQTSGEEAPIKITLEKWYSNNITDKSKVVIGKFCNDRNTKNSEAWVQNGGTEQLYVAQERLWKNPKIATFSCSNGDVYSLSVGLITADETQFAGASGRYSQNYFYYLYNGENYWTMTPSEWGGNTGAYTYVFIVNNEGFPYHLRVYETASLRPVINLRSDVTFNAGSDGTQNNPYIVQ